MMPIVLSYRHAYHAGNHADVLKHLVLISCLDHLGKKETPYRYIDTHAGAGAFSFSAGYAAEHEEWRGGLERLRAFVGAEHAGAPPPLIRAYLAHVEAFRQVAGEDAYPGSPAIAADFLRGDDRAFFFELHPADHGILEERFSGNRRVKVRKEDGLSGLRSLLPPPSRRGLVLVDPSYEVKDEYEAVVGSISEALQRFATGVYLVWYPLLEREEARALPERLLALHAGRRCRAEIRVKRAREDGWGMCGSGIIALNPPWTLRAALEEALPYLVRALGEDGAASNLQWEEDSATTSDASVSNTATRS